ncbi:Transcriptional regulator with XRE-family HTH domain OS=Streptomyces violarus OX=67380 GN=FHS41_001222 PE=4 SV=1 [Streptomyces violarus]
MVDALYDVVAANRGIMTLIDGVCETLLEPPLNAMRLALHPRGLAPRIRNLRAWRGHLLEQMERQIALHRSEPLRALYEEVAAYPVPAADPAEEPSEPVPYFALPLRIEHEGRTLSFISSISTFNTPMDVTVAELAIETLLPADPATVKYLQSLLP